MNLISQLYFFSLALALVLVLVNGQTQNKTELAPIVTPLSLLDRLRNSIRQTSSVPSTTELKSNKISERVTVEDEDDDDKDDGDNDDADNDDGDDDDDDDDVIPVKSNKSTALAPSSARFIGLKTFLFTIKALILGSLIGLTIKDALIRGLLWALTLYVKHLLFPNILGPLLGTGLLGFG